MGYRGNYKAKPFIKWAGGKTQLLSDIERALPSDFIKSHSTYVEPFVGGGSVIFWMLQRYPHIQHAVINDINEKLINVYRAIKRQPQDLIKLLLTLQDAYLPLSHDARTEMYLEKRLRFNDKSIDGLEQSSLFIFLNRTCFNGLYRENAKGFFNVPHGKYANPTICDASTILADSVVLQKVDILCGDFAETIKYATPETLYYFDPPYKPLNETSSFNSYVKEVFDDSEQIRLRDFCNQISERGCKFILSNSDVKGKNPDDDFFDNLYEDYIIRRVLATRMVNANPDKRGKLSELMISNIENVSAPQTLFSNFNFAT